MGIQSNVNSDINSIQRGLNLTAPLVVLGDENGLIPADPGYWWVRPVQAGGGFGKSFRVKGCLLPIPMTAGYPVELGISQGEQAVIGPDFAGVKSLGGNPIQSAVVDPNANNPAFVNQAMITTAYGQIVEGTLTVAIRGALILDAGIWYKLTGNTGALTVPSAGNHCIAVIACQSDHATLEVQYSTAKDDLIPLTLEDLQEAWTLMSNPLTNTPLWAFELADAQTSLVESDRWLDLRKIVNFTLDAGPGSGDVVGPASAVGDDFVQFNGTSGKLIKDGGLSRTIDGTLAGNSDLLIPSEKAVKTYVDAAAPSYPIAVNKGGTHLATLTAHGLLVGNGTSNPTFLSPSTVRFVAISDGTDWTSRALVAADIPTLPYATSPLTTKGDVWTYSSVDARLAVGANNTVLVADSTASTGNKWSATLAGLTLTSPTIAKIANLTANGPVKTSGGDGTLGVSAIDLSGTEATGILAAGRFPALTGDVTTVAGALAATLANTAVTPASYTYASITVDSKGRITAASNGTVPTASPLTTKGDLWTYSTVNARLAVGANNTVLVADSAQTTGNKWSASLTGLTLDNGNTITLKDTLFTLQDDGDTTKQAQFQLSGITTSTTRTYTLPDATGTVALIAATQTLTNKTLDNTNTITLKDTLFTLQDDGDTTKQTVFQLSGITTATTRTLTVPNASGTIALASSAIAGYIMQAPTVTADNTISAATTSITLLTLKTSDNNTAKNALEFQSSAGAVVAQVGATGLASFLAINSTPIGSTTPSTIAGTTYTGTGLGTITISDTNTVSTVYQWTLSHNVSGTAGNNIGSGIKFKAQADNASTPVLDVELGRFDFYWSTVAYTTRKGRLDIVLADNASTNRTILSGLADGTAPRIAFLGAGPIVRQANNAAIDTALDSFGFFNSSRTTAPFGATLAPRAGTTAANTSPVKFTSGSLLTSPEAGSMEFLTDGFYFTGTTSTKRYFNLGRLNPNVALTSQTASIASTTILTPPNDGEYMAVIVLTDTTTSTSGGLVLVTISYTDENGAQTQSTTALPLSAAGYLTAQVVFHAKTSAAIQYSTTVSGVIVGTPAYSLYINLIRLS